MLLVSNQVLFVNEKRIYNDIKYITEIKYINFVNWVLAGFWILTKIKIDTFVDCQNDTIHAYKSLYLHCGLSTKVPSKLKSIDENEVC